MLETVAYILAAVGGYLAGSIPTGYLVAAAKGIDIRSVGSGNIGATNVFRVLGKAPGLLVLLADAAKGFLACWLLPHVPAVWNEGLKGSPAGQERLALLAGVAAILGHNYSCWLKFRGGKGVATTAGVLLALVPKAFLVGLGVWLAVFGLSRYVSLASIAAALALPVAVWAVGSSSTLTAVATLLGALAIFKHRSNIQRLWQGTEHRFGRPRHTENHR